MEILLWIAIFVLSLTALVKATDWFIEGSEQLGVYFDVKPFIIGVFVLGLGTSLPELVISLISVFEGASEVVAGNVFGSNIANIFLILGVAAIVVKESTVDFEGWDFDLPLFIASAFFMVLTAWDGAFTLTEGAFFLGIFIAYIMYNVQNHRKKKKIVPEELEEVEKEIKKEKKLGWDAIIRLIGAPILIYIGAKYTVESVIWIAEVINIGKEIIAASAISLGTSLPELVVSFIAVKKGKIDEMVGNIIGSNIFNILLVMGLPAMFGTILIPSSMLLFALPMMLLATAIAFVVIQDKKITRWEGIMLVLFYLFFLGQIFNLFCLSC